MKGLETLFMNYRVPESRYDEVTVRWVTERLLGDALTRLVAMHGQPCSIPESAPDGVGTGPPAPAPTEWCVDFVLTAVYECELVCLELCTADDKLADAFGAMIDTVTERMLAAKRLTPTWLWKKQPDESVDPVVRMGTMVPYRVACDGQTASLECLLDRSWGLTQPIAVTDVLVALGFASNGRRFLIDLGSPTQLNRREFRLLERLAVSRVDRPDLDLPLLIEFDKSNLRSWRWREH